MTSGVEVRSVGGLGTLATTANHTMRHRLPDYVLPKLPRPEVLAGVREVVVVGDHDLNRFGTAGKAHRKRFNWRRPEFTVADETMYCRVPPGRDYAYHYAKLLEVAASMLDPGPVVRLVPPSAAAAVHFVRRTLPAGIGPVDGVLIGYVEHLFADDVTWVSHPGFGYRYVEVGAFRLALIGCEYSYWGDLGGALVTVLAEQGITDWVTYVGKLGTLRPDIPPNRYIGTGTTSRIEGRQLHWSSRLDLRGVPHNVLTGQRHATEPSTLDETLAWCEELTGAVDLVDPEIGRMAEAALTAGISFDYLHLISDNLAGGFEQGLYDEHADAVRRERRTCLRTIETILRSSLR